MEKEIKTLESQAYEYACPAAKTLYRQGFIKEEWLRDMLAQAYLAGHETEKKDQWQDAATTPPVDEEKKKQYKKYLVYFFSTAIFFFWLGMLFGITTAHHSLEKQSEKYRVEMAKDSLYFEYRKTLK